MSSAPKIFPAGRARLLYRPLLAFPVACFSLTLLADVAYWQTANLMWLNFSAWLLLVGIVVGCAAAVVGLVEAVARRAARAQWPGWAFFACGVVVLCVAFVNNLVHAADGWTAVVPYGLALSALTVALMLLCAALDASFKQRSYRVTVDG